MSLRNTLNEKPMLTGGIVVAVLVVLAIFWLASGSSSGPSEPTRAFYTVDDGATWFPDSIDKIPPFEYQGKQAVRAYVFRCPDGKEFVGYLERYNDQAKAILDRFREDRAAGRQITNSQEVARAEMGGKQVKRPNDKNWVVLNPMALAQMQAKCPDGSTPVAVE